MPIGLLNGVEIAVNFSAGGAPSLIGSLTSGMPSPSLSPGFSSSSGMPSSSLSTTALPPVESVSEPPIPPLPAAGDEVEVDAVLPDTTLAPPLPAAAPLVPSLKSVTAEHDQPNTTAEGSAPNQKSRRI